jgi:hypothetical protein
MIELYMAIWLIGLILLIIFAILGGFGLDADAGDVDFDFDADADVDFDVDVGDVDIDADAGVGGHPSPLSLPIVLVFMTSFGALGMLLEVFNFNWVLVPIVSAIVSIIVATGMFFVMAKVFSATQATSVVPLHKLVGLKAKVSVYIKDGNEGQVVVVPPGAGRILVGAISNKDIAVDSVVEILEVVGDVVRVKKIKKGKKKQAVMK